MANYDPHLLSRFRSNCTPPHTSLAHLRPPRRPGTRVAALGDVQPGALVDLRDEITSRIATYRQPGVSVRIEDRVALEAVMAEIEERESRAAAAKW